MAARARAAKRGPDPVFLRAQREWNDRFFGLARGKRNWQLAAAALLLVNVILAGALAWLSTQSRITPFVVEVDRLGQAVAFGPAEQLRQTDERLIRYLLGMYVHDLRTVVGDSDAQKDLLDRAYAHTRGRAVAFLNEHFSKENPFEAANRARVRVQVQSILPLSEKSWQVQWTETRDGAGARQGTSRGWQAILTVEIDPPETTETVLTNPLGLYVTEINWTPTASGGAER